MRTMLEHNKVIVFPSKTLTAWNGIPRFNFIEANLQEVDSSKLPDLVEKKRRQIIRNKNEDMKTGDKTPKADGESERPPSKAAKKQDF